MNILQYFHKNRFKRILKTHNVLCTYIDKIYGNELYINNIGNIYLGQDIWFNSFQDGSIFRNGLSTYNSKAKIIIKDRVKMNGALIHCNESVEIMEDCRIAPGVIICDNDSHNVARSVVERALPPISAPIVLHKNVWIGMNSIILKGVIIGENTIIAAGSVVTKSCKPNSIYGGNPAKFIKSIK